MNKGQKITVDGVLGSFNLRQYFLDIVKDLNQMRNENISVLSSGQILSFGYVTVGGEKIHAESEILDINTEQWFDDMNPPVIYSNYTGKSVLNRENYLQKFINDVKIIEEL